ncbi:hypothetical protein [Streptomyces sp. NBC_01429]|uniref:hypothetical protein n=1 Tax=Streptomyces sp. NBC_01429 TaxID=2903862 RepID=UPI002E2C0461|nr:hypothetical protein [Streptomyces sp. NBC_01429]
MRTGTGTEARTSGAGAPPRAVRPRAMVMDEVWRRLDGVGPLSGPQGGPLSRTVKLVLDPLVIRPVLHPQCAGPLVTADGAALLATLMTAAGDTLRATAAWFTLLKQVRRGLRITEGHPQDLYFQLCFELATTLGPPDPATGRATAEEAVRQVHDAARGRTTQALREYVTDPAHAAGLTEALAAAWADRRVREAAGDAAGTAANGGAADTGNAANRGAAGGALVREVLDACAPRAGGGRRDDGERALGRLVVDGAGTAAGLALWDGGPAATGTTPGLPGPGLPSARELGLTERPVPAGPRLGGGAVSTSALGAPFDRTVHERIFTVLQTSNDRAALAPVPELVLREIGRSCAPWALADESLRVAATVGARLALGLSPLGGGPLEVSPLGAAYEEESAAGTEAHRTVNSRWRREAYVLRARRLAVDPGGVREGPLARIAEDLRTPWRAYLRRLWVRLHGRDVREAPIGRVDELWDVLDGVARSVILDHRGRVRQALSALPVGGGTGS